MKLRRRVHASVPRHAVRVRWGAEKRGGRRGRWDRTEGKGVRGVGSHYVEGGDVTDGDGWLHVRQV